MLTTMVSLALASSLAPGQVKVDPWKTAGEPKTLPHKSIPYDKWKGKKYIGGGVSITLRYHWAYIGPRTYDFKSSCVLTCLGDKHIVHQLCDVTCDTICETVHEKEIKAEFEFSGDNSGGKNGWQKSMKLRFGKHGANGAQAGHLANSIKASATKEVNDKIEEYTYKYKMGHFNDAPCSTQDHEFRYSLYSLWVMYSIFKDGKKVAGTGPGIEENKRTLLGTMKIPYDAFEESDPVENCKCQFIKEKQKEYKYGFFVPPDDDEGATDGGSADLRFAGLYIDPESDGTYGQYNSSHEGDAMIEYRLEGLSSFTVSATNMTGMPIGLVLMPGTTFEPEDDRFQTMVNLDSVQWSIGPHSTREIVLPVSGPSQDPVTVGGYMACLNIEKKQPDGSAIYNLGPTADSRLIDMGYEISKQRFRGPWTQAQLWVYTDGASLQEINRRLFPPVSGRRYLNSLYELANKYHVDLHARKYRDVWTSELMLADGVSLAVIEWFVQEMAKRDALSLASWVNGNRGKFSYIFAADAQDWYIEYAANVATALCNSNSLEVQSAGLEFLARTVPKGKRAALMENGGLDGAVSLALRDGENAVAAMALVEEYDSELAEQLKTVPDELPFPEIDPPKRARAS